MTVPDARRDEAEPDDNGEESGDCYWCGGEGWEECDDPIQCTDEHDEMVVDTWTANQEARLEAASMAARNTDREFCPARARDVQGVLKSLSDYRNEVGRLSALLLERASRAGPEP